MYMYSMYTYNNFVLHFSKVADIERPSENSPDLDSEECETVTWMVTLSSFQYEIGAAVVA